MELKYIVYVTVNLCNGKLYFGVHRTNPKVFDGYIGNSIYRQASATLNVAFHRAVRKYGYKNFRRTTLAIFPDTEEGKKAAYKLEAEIINPISLRSKYIYNEVRGGIGGGNEKQMRTVYQFTLDGNYLRSYKCTRDAAIAINPENLNNTRQAIKNCCMGTSYSSFGYYWSYFKEFIQKEDFSHDIKRRYNKIAQYTISGKFLRYFDNIDQARSETGLVNLYYAIKNNTSCGGYQWRWYTNDKNIPPLENEITTYRHKPIIMTDSFNNESEYESIKQCIEIHPEFSSKGIRAVINGKNKTHKKCKFRWKDDDIV